jgi:NAD+ synthase
MNDDIAKIDLSLDPPTTVGLLTTFVCNQFEAKGFKDAVLGVSGGVDSALGVALLVTALGPDHVTGLAMPAAQSDPQSLKDARLVASTFGIKLIEQPIGGLISEFFGKEKDINRVRIGNAAARFRMIRLFDYSQNHRALVIGTSNKTELLLGYGTWWGDLASAINPIGDLYKTQVWGIADWLGVPEEVVYKAPTADLWKGQTDEGELGFTYAEVDRLLYLLVDRDYSIASLQELGFKPTFISRVLDMVAKSQFKRSLPTIPKLSMKTVGIDFHFAREWAGRPQ